MIKTKAINEELDLDLQNIPEEAFERFAVRSEEELLRSLDEAEADINAGNYLTLEEFNERMRKKYGF